jgi:sugar phosphate isomerase/epimerase
MTPSITRRTLARLATAAAVAEILPAKKRVPVGIELYSVRDELAKDLMSTVRAVAKMGYEVVEFYSPYYQWTPDYAKQVRKLLDDLGVRCLSTHNSAMALGAEGLKKAIELNRILGSKSIVMASAGRVTNLDGWKGVAATLTQAAATLKPLGMRAGFHNHMTEFRPLDGKRPMDILAANTPKDVTLQLDIGTCIEAGVDPLVWIKANPGRIRSMHCKDWVAGTGPDKGYRVLGEDLPGCRVQGRNRVLPH